MISSYTYEFTKNQTVDKQQFSSYTSNTPENERVEQKNHQNLQRKIIFTKRELLGFQVNFSRVYTPEN